MNQVVWAILAIIAWCIVGMVFAFSYFDNRRGKCILLTLECFCSAVLWFGL
jgi:hypothetical protein